MKITEH